MHPGRFSRFDKSNTELKINYVAYLKAPSSEFTKKIITCPPLWMLSKIDHVVEGQFMQGLASFEGRIVKATRDTQGAM
jgi:hypothetical protein